jgi:protein disulfide-isomerase A1
MINLKLLVLAGLGLLVSARLPEVDGVLVLDQENFDEAVETYPEILVVFYAPWSETCKQLTAELAKAAAVLNAHEPAIKVAKVDVTKNSELKSKAVVRTFPTLKYYLDGFPTDYTGGRTEQEIVEWVLSKQGPTYLTVNSAELEAAFAVHSVALVEFAPSPSAVFTKVAKAMDNKVKYFFCNDPAALEDYEAASGDIVLFKNYDELKTLYQGPKTVEGIVTWLIFNSRPWVMTYNEETMEHIYRNANTALFIFRHEDEALNYSELLTHLSRKVRGHLTITHTDLSLEANESLKLVLGLKPEQQPIAFIMDPADPLNRYRYEGEEFSAEALADFVKSYMNKDLKTHFKSDPIPADPYDAHVRVIVGKNANDLIYDLERDVLVLFYAHWCLHSQKLHPEYYKVAEAFKDDDSIVVAKIDSSNNEVPGQNVISMPTLKFFAANNKAGIDFEGERNSEQIIEFVKSHAVAKTLDGKLKLEL